MFSLFTVWCHSSHWVVGTTSLPPVLAGLVTCLMNRMGLAWCCGSLRALVPGGPEASAFTFLGLRCHIKKGELVYWSMGGHVKREVAAFHPPPSESLTCVWGHHRLSSTSSLPRWIQLQKQAQGRRPKHPQSFVRSDVGMVCYGVLQGVNTNSSLHLRPTLWSTY